MDRDEYLERAKKRALEYLDRHDVKNAVTSMCSDLSKHEDFKGIANSLFPLAFWIMVNKDEFEARRFIVGFR